MPDQKRYKYNAEDFELLLARAQREIELADHLLYVTYPLVNDLKFLVSITEHIIKADRLALDALLEYARYYKVIDPYVKKFANEIRIYKKYVETHYGLDPKFLRLLKKMYEIQGFDMSAVLRFSRGSSYILTTEDYQTKTLNIDMVKRYSNASKDFVSEIKKIIKAKPKISREK